MFSCDLIQAVPLVPLAEAMSREDLSNLADRLRAGRRWRSDGRPVEEIRVAIDPEFIHHQEHYDRMLHGGETESGRKYTGFRGIRAVRLEAEDGRALVTVDGSKEWDPKAHTWQTQIKFMNYDLIRRQPRLTWTERARLLLKDNVMVHCTCPAYRYYHQHAATQKGFAIIPEEREAPERNPDNRSGACKHVDHTLRWIGGNYPTLASALKRHAATEESTVKTVFESRKNMTLEGAMQAAARASLNVTIPVHVVKVRESHIVEAGDLPDTAQILASFKGGSRMIESMVSAEFLGALSDLKEKAARAGMGRTAEALKFAINQAKVEGAVIVTPPNTAPAVTG